MILPKPCANTCLKMREKGADVVVVLAHSGLSADPYKVMAENSVYYLSEIPGVNAIMFGHAHAVFPGKDFADIEGADITKGTLNGVPAVMPGMWGDHLGVVDLQLSNDSGKWQVTQAKAEARPIYDIANKIPRGGRQQAGRNTQSRSRCHTPVCQQANR